MTLVRITEPGRVRPGDYVVESTPAEIDGLTPEEAVMFEGGVIWWRYLEEEEGVHCHERPAFMPEPQTPGRGCSSKPA